MKQQIMTHDPVIVSPEGAESGKSGLDLFHSIRKVDIDLDAPIGPRNPSGLREIDLADGDV